jgi:hypothetical protein
MVPQHLPERNKPAGDDLNSGSVAELRRVLVPAFAEPIVLAEGAKRRRAMPSSEERNSLPGRDRFIKFNLVALT